MIRLPTHYDTAVGHRDVFKGLDAEGPTAPLALMGRSAWGGNKQHP